MPDTKFVSDDYEMGYEYALTELHSWLVNSYDDIVPVEAIVEYIEGVLEWSPEVVED